MKLAMTKRKLAITSCSAVFCLLAALAASPARASQNIDSPEEQLSIQVSETQAREFRVHLARSAAERGRGLMFVRKMPQDVGMLFLYDKPNQISMWMKNTYIPLDMIFIGTDGRIIRIVRNTEPHSLASIASGGPAIAVLELNGGISDKLGLAAGQRVLHRLLPSDEAR
jgi:uncharacterized membrane protein (UPF0127 family)